MNVTGRNTLEELDTLTLQCTAIPPASISWLKRSTEGIILFTNSSRISLSAKQTISPSGEFVTISRLTIRDVTEADGGDYICEAQNGAQSIPTADNILVNIKGTDVSMIISYVEFYYSDGLLLQ